MFQKIYFITYLPISSHFKQDPGYISENFWNIRLTWTKMQKENKILYYCGNLTKRAIVEITNARYKTVEAN